MTVSTMTQRLASTMQYTYKPPSPGGPMLGAPVSSPAYADGDLQRFLTAEVAKLGHGYASPAAAPKMLHVGVNYYEDGAMSLSRSVNDAVIYAWVAQRVFGRRADEVSRSRGRTWWRHHPACWPREARRVE